MFCCALVGVPLLAHPFDESANMVIEIVLRHDDRTGEQSMRLDLIFRYDSRLASFMEAGELDKNEDGRITLDERDERFFELADEMTPIFVIQAAGQKARAVPRIEQWRLTDLDKPDDSVYTAAGLDRFNIRIGYFFTYDLLWDSPPGPGTHPVTLTLATRDINVFNPHDSILLYDDRDGTRRLMSGALRHDRTPRPQSYQRASFNWSIPGPSDDPATPQWPRTDPAAEPADPANEEDHGTRRLRELDEELYDDQATDAFIRRAFVALRDNEADLGVWLAVLLTVFLLGAWHAVQPGHGKTLVASYLIGTQGTKTDAVFLGIVVTAAHTSGVFMLMAGAWAASEIWPGVLQNPEQQLAEWITLAVGATIFGLGFTLVMKRAGGKAHAHDIFGRHIDPADDHHHDHEHEHKSPEDSDILEEVEDHTHDHDHPHTHAHDHHHHGHGHHHHGHDHGHGHHHHHELDPSKLSRWEILRLGILGGVIPCPTGFVIGLIAFQQQWYFSGLILVIVFSLGLAVVLAAIGLVLVQSKSYLAARRRESKSRLLTMIESKLPVFGALVITMIGVVMVMFALIRLDLVDPNTFGI